MQALKDHSCIDWATPLLLAATVFAGCFVRFYSLRDVYEEYDDVGVIALYKSQATREAKTYPILRTSALALNVTTDAGRAQGSRAGHPFRDGPPQPGSAPAIRPGLQIR